MKIIHIGNPSRSSIGITQGLMKTNNELIITCPYISFGKKIIKSTDNIIEYCKNADLIFVSDLNGEPYKKHFNEYNLWKRIIYYDYRDSTSFDEEMIHKSLISFKRSFVFGQDRQIILNNTKILPIMHCAIDEYYEYFNLNKIYNVGCFFDATEPTQLGIRRANLINCAIKIKYENSLIGHSTGKKQNARLAYQHDKNDNCFKDFLKLQSKCKIVLTAQPTHCEGDNRTWEAFSSGAMVVMDKFYLPFNMMPQKNKHCLIYDANNIESIYDILDQVKWYLNHEEERLKIATCGYQHVIMHHRPINRIKYMLHHAGFKTFL